jgi:hypothetical protein
LSRYLERKPPSSNEVTAPGVSTQPVPFNLVPTQKPATLSPVAALCLRIVKGWIGVVRRGKGGEIRNGVPYTRLKAAEVREQLEAEQGVEVSTKTVQRALTSLVEGGHLSRRQLYKHRYNRTYWYAPGESEQKAERYRPRTVAARFQGAVGEPPPPVPPRERHSVPTERTVVSPQALSAQINHSTLEAGDSQTASKPPTEQTPCGQPEPPQEEVKRAWGRKGSRQAARAIADTSSTRWMQAQQKLAEVVERAKARGFGAAQGSLSPIPTATRYVAESAQAAGFLR